MSMVAKRLFTTQSMESAKKILADLPKSNIDLKIKNLLEKNSDIAKKYNLKYTPKTEEEQLKEIVELSNSFKLARANAFETMGKTFKDAKPVEQKTIQDFVPEYTA
ncbi:hypothetical protein RB653_007436 [Dictyostelium firmibasis]|uniref:Uncharacterized protein n=1 Tax=Dictyostelium firmibasis TaxID=79012 RepID=A0AAN7TWH9_9MYCE